MFRLHFNARRPALPRAAHARHPKTPIILLLVTLLASAACEALESLTGNRPASPATELEELLVEGRRTGQAGPTRGLLLRPEMLTGNLQSVSGKEIAAAGATSLTEFMDGRLASISINNYSGNPFQADVNYRGFTASPQIGTPQGLSVFLDGVRMNEPFGDVVNWDMIPLNALSTFELVPGSNPLFGQNTLGGALNLRTRNGFDDAGVDLSLSGGAWGRVQGGLAAGAHRGAVAGFVALSGFDEDGWRRNSPSEVKQGLVKLSFRDGPMDVNFTTLVVGDDLLGNGLVPRELYAVDPKAVFTSPDRTRNSLRQFTLDGLVELGERINLTAQVYHRDSTRRAVGGDIYEDFIGLAGQVPPRIAQRVSARRVERPDPVTGQPVERGPFCAYLDANQDGVRDYEFDINLDFQPHPETRNASPREIYRKHYREIQASAHALLGIPADQTLSFRDFINEEWAFRRALPPINVAPGGVAGVDCANVSYEFADGQRNGAKGQTETQRAGVIAGTPIGVLTRTDIEQDTQGASLQLNFNLERHAFMFGAAFDASAADYGNHQRLGNIDATHRVYADPNDVDAIYFAATHDVPVNEFDGFSNTLSAYFSETYSPFTSLHVTASGRYNRTQVKNNLLTSRTSDASLASRTDFDAGLPTHILCPRADPRSCPREPNGSSFSELARLDPDLDPLLRVGAAERYVFKSFNPALGVSYVHSPAFNAFANWSEGTRAPSVVELGCAFDATPVWPDPANPGQYVDHPTVDANGVETIPTARSLSRLNGSCTLPSTLSGDPYLPQVRAQSIEAGTRGALGDAWSWQFALYRTDLFDDIYFVGITAERSYFDTVGHTRRQGLELSINRRSTFFDVRLNYGLNEATFQSNFWLNSPHNSSVNLDPTRLNQRGLSAANQIEVRPGDRMPGMPLQSLNINLDVRPERRFLLALNMVAHSGSFARGNENNRARAGCFHSVTDPTTGVTRLASCARDTSPYDRLSYSGGRLPGYVLFNLRASYALRPAVSVFVDVDNLLDKDYFSAGRLGVNPFVDGPAGARGPSGWNYNSTEWRRSDFVGPGGPRALWLGVEAHF